MTVCKERRRKRGMQKALGSRCGGHCLCSVLPQAQACDQNVGCGFHAR